MMYLMCNMSLLFIHWAALYFVYEYIISYLIGIAYSDSIIFFIFNPVLDYVIYSRFLKYTNCSENVQ